MKIIMLTMRCLFLLILKGVKMLVVMLQMLGARHGGGPVSYTHLTLPTILLV